MNDQKPSEGRNQSSFVVVANQQQSSRMARKVTAAAAAVLSPCGLQQRRRLANVPTTNAVN